MHDRERMSIFEVSNGIITIIKAKHMPCESNTGCLSNPRSSSGSYRIIPRFLEEFFQAQNLAHSLQHSIHFESFTVQLFLFFFCNYVITDSLARCLDRTPKKTAYVKRIGYSFPLAARWSFCPVVREKETGAGLQLQLHYFSSFGPIISCCAVFAKERMSSTVALLPIGPRRSDVRMHSPPQSASPLPNPPQSPHSFSRASLAKVNMGSLQKSPASSRRGTGNLALQARDSVAIRKRTLSTGATSVRSARQSTRKPLEDSSKVKIFYSLFLLSSFNKNNIS